MENILKHIAKKKTNKKKTKREREREKERERERKKKKQYFENFILKKPRCYFLHDLLSFCVLGKGKHVFSKGDLLAPPTEDNSYIIARPIFPAEF